MHLCVKGIAVMSSWCVIGLLEALQFFRGGCRNSLAAVAGSEWFIETTMEGWGC